MGNFYTNITVRDSDADAVAATLASAGRRAYVARGNGMTVVFDERCDTQDLRELEGLARQISRRHGPALAVCNHDDDVLWYALASKGKTVDRYDSLPSFSGQGGDEPAGGDAAALCAAFDRPDAVDAVTALLRRPHRDYTFEIERHEELCWLVSLPAESAGLGYRYVEQGEWAARSSAGLIAIGGAPEPAAGDGHPTGTGPMVDAEAGAAIRVAAVAPQFRMIRSAIDVPPELSDVLGTGRVNAMLALTRLQGYMVTHKLIKGGGRGVRVQADATVRAILARAELGWEDVPTHFAERFGIPPLTADELASIARGDADTMRRFQGAMGEILRTRAAETAAVPPNRSPRPGEPRVAPGDAMARAMAVARTIYPLVRSEIEVPPDFAPVLGSGRVNAMRAFMRLQAYIVDHGLVSTEPPRVVRGDAIVQAILGAESVEADRLADVFRRRLDVPPWTEEEDAALGQGDPSFLTRLLDLKDEFEQERRST